MQMTLGLSVFLCFLSQLSRIIVRHGSSINAFCLVAITCITKKTFTESSGSIQHWFSAAKVPKS